MLSESFVIASKAYPGSITKFKLSQASRAIRMESNLLMIAGKAKKEAAIDEGILNVC